MNRIRSARAYAHAFVWALAALGCGATGGSNDASPQAVCKTLEDLRLGRIDVGHSDPNEFVGHVRSLEALIAVAPAKPRGDLEFVREKLIKARDAGGWTTLLDFADLQDPELGNAEGRFTQFVADECGLEYGAVHWEMEDGEDRQPTCAAWPRVGSPLVNNRFPYLIATAAANYFSSQFWTVPILPAPPGFMRIPRGGRVVFHGEYPYARYFAFHPNDFETNNFPTLRDVDLNPDSGSRNPWREPLAENGSRFYTAQLVNSAAPAEPERNTVYVGESASGDFNPAVFLLYRIYAADQGALPPNSAGVELPSVTIFDADGEQQAHFEACDPYPESEPVAEDRSRMPAFPVPDHRSVFNPGGLNIEDNWGLPVTLLGNRDVLYMGFFYSRTAGDVFAVRARKPQTPSRKSGVPLHSQDVEMRLFTVCGYNFWNGRANDCVVDEDIPENDAGEYTVVVSDAESRPANANAENDVYWLDWGPFLDGQLTFRNLLSSDPLLQRIRAVVDSGAEDPETSRFIPRSAHCSRSVFEAGGFEACVAHSESTLRRRARQTFSRSKRDRN